MKKQFMLLLTAALLCGCGSSSNKEETKPASSAVEISESAVSEAAKEESQEESETAAQAGFEPMEVYNQDGVVITATGLDDGFMSQKVKLEITNNSEKNIMVQARDESINGIMVDGAMSEDVAAGKKANTGITFYNSSLKDAGIDQINDIEFTLAVINDDDWMDSVESGLITLTFHESDGSETSSEADGNVLYDAGGITIRETGLSDDSFMGTEILIQADNATDQPITIQVRDMSVNGYMVSPVCSIDVMPGKKASDNITILSSDLEDNGIETIEEAELSFHIFNADSWDTIADTDPITISFAE